LRLGKEGDAEVLEMTEKERLVEKGYNRIAEEYQADRHALDNRKELEEFAGLLPIKAKILDVGCGAGVPVARFLVESGFQVVGIDFSGKMLKLARKNVAQATFIRKDMTKLDFADNSFDGLTAFYSIIHVPREKHSLLFQSFHNILKPDGVMLVCMVPDEWEATEEHYGTSMFWSHYSPEKSLQLVKDAGFQTVFDKILERGKERHYWILARNKK
jgi:ubiquinone/menaquinone biosynthesis C-methylase UbiE